MYRVIHPSLFACLCALAACAPDLRIGTVTQEGGNDCDYTGCGVNNPLIASYLATPIVTTKGVDAPSGFSHNGFELNGKLMAFTIDEGELVAIDQNGVKYRGDAVIGGIFRLEYGGDAFELSVQGRQMVEYWTRPGEELPMYLMAWRDPVSGRTGDLCQHRAPPSSDPDWGAVGHYAFFVAGEEYDVDSAAVIETGGGAADLVNIACAGSGLAKTEINSYSANIPAADPWATQPEERELLLRVYGAAYCYDDTTGPPDVLERYTEPGEPLLIEDSRGWMTPNLGAAVTVEAVWSEDGVVCLEEARRPDIVGDLGLDCGIPTCTWMGLEGIADDGWKSVGAFRTLLPGP